MDLFTIVHLHPVTCASDWPAEVVPIANRLAEPLPPWVAHGPYPPTASFATYLVPQLKVLAALPKTDASNASSPLLKDMFDLIMSNCADLRTLLGRPSFEPMVVKTITFGLIASLFKSFPHDLIPRNYARFIDGETLEFSLVQTLTNEDLARSEAKFEAFLEPEQVKNEDAVENGCASGSTESNESLDNEAIHEEIIRRRGSSWFDQPEIPEQTERTERSQLSTQPSVASLEVPDKARILEPLLHDYVDVPVLCVADAEAMPAVMSKLLYQRHVWGLRDPVLGFIISNDGLTIRFAIGWMEENETEKSAHMATSGNSFDEGVGAYRLIDPVACMSLAQFILGLDIDALLDNLSTQARKFVSSPWGWSRDGTRSSCCTLCGNSFIEQWRLEVADAVQISVDCTVSPLSTNDLNRPPKTSKLKNIRPSIRCSPSRPEFSDAAPSMPDSSPHKDIQSVSSKHSNYSGKGSKPFKSHDFDARLDDSTMESLIDRNIYIVPYVSVAANQLLPMVQHIHQHMVRMRQIYDQDTEREWVEARKREDNMHDIIAKYRHGIFADFQTFMREKQADALCNRLPSMVEACDIAKITGRLATSYRAKEVERRQAWDQLFLKAFLALSSTDQRTIEILCEHSLNFPVNPYLMSLLKGHHLTLADLRKYVTRLAFVKILYFSIADAYEFQHASDTSQIHLTRLAQLQEAWEHMVLIITRIQRVTNSPTMTDALGASSFEQMVRERCSKEPLSGICETIFAVRCRDAGRHIHETVFHALCAQKPSSLPADIFDESVALVENFQLIFSPASNHPQKKAADPSVIHDGKGSKLEAKKPKKPKHLEEDNEKHVNELEKDMGFAPPDVPLRDWLKAEVPQDAAIRMKSTLDSLSTDPLIEDASPKSLHTESSTGTPNLKNRQGASSPLESSFEYLLVRYRKSPKARHFGNDFLLALFFVASDSTIHNTTDEARTYAAAVLAFFELLGIVNQPVYLLIQNGNQGTLSMAMYNQSERKERQSLIMEWNVHVYDITNISDVYELFIFMQRLAKRAQDLREKFMQEYLPAFLARVKQDPYILEWSMRSWISKIESDARFGGDAKDQDTEEEETT